MTSSSQSGAETLNAVQILRAVSAIMVVVLHACEVSTPRISTKHPCGS